MRGNCLFNYYSDCTRQILVICRINGFPGIIYFLLSVARRLLKVFEKARAQGKTQLDPHLITHLLATHAQGTTQLDPLVAAQLEAAVVKGIRDVTESARAHIYYS